MVYESSKRAIILVSNGPLTPPPLSLTCFSDLYTYPIHEKMKYIMNMQDQVEFVVKPECDLILDGSERTITRVAAGNSHRYRRQFLSTYSTSHTLSLSPRVFPRV